MGCGAQNLGKLSIAAKRDHSRFHAFPLAPQILLPRYIYHERQLGGLCGVMLRQMPDPCVSVGRNACPAAC